MAHPPLTSMAGTWHDSQLRNVELSFPEDLSRLKLHGFDSEVAEAAKPILINGLMDGGARRWRLYQCDYDSSVSLMFDFMGFRYEATGAYGIDEVMEVQAIRKVGRLGEHENPDEFWDGSPPPLVEMLPLPEQDLDEVADIERQEAATGVW